MSALPDQHNDGRAWLRPTFLFYFSSNILIAVYNLSVLSPMDFF